jgi:hypothetical protein
MSATSLAVCSNRTTSGITYLNTNAEFFGRLFISYYTVNLQRLWPPCNFRATALCALGAASFLRFTYHARQELELAKNLEIRHAEILRIHSFALSPFDARGGSANFPRVPGRATEVLWSRMDAFCLSLADRRWRRLIWLSKMVRCIRGALYDVIHTKSFLYLRRKLRHRANRYNRRMMYVPRSFVHDCPRPSFKALLGGSPLLHHCSA